MNDKDFQPRVIPMKGTKEANHEDDVLDEALHDATARMALSLKQEERRRKRFIWVAAFAIGAVFVTALVIGVILAMRIVLGIILDSSASPASPSSAQPPSELVEIDRGSPKKIKIGPENIGIRIDPSACDSPEWKEAIERQLNVSRIRSGHGRMTLLRVILPDASSETSLQISGTKVVGLGQGGGGAFRQIQNGDFVVVDHINSGNRRNGKDPIEIGGFACHRARMYVDVPATGKLGILGDVFLTPCKPEEMGRMVVKVDIETDEPLEIRDYAIGPIAVGGRYGKAFPFSSDHVCDTGPLAPGKYKTLLPGFDQVKSRWTIEVLPGTVTQVHLSAISQKEVVKTKVVMSPKPEQKENPTAAPANL